MKWFVGDLRTGLVQARNLPVKSGSVTPTLNAAGQITATMQLPLVVNGVAVDVPSFTQPGRCFLGAEVLWGGTRVILDAGPIWQRTINLDTGVLEVQAASLLSYYTHRFVLPTGSGTQRGRDSSWSGLSLRTIQKRLIQQAQSWAEGQLPIVFPEADITDDHERNYLGIDVNVVADMLTNLAGVIDGPDFAFRPYWADPTHVAWQFVTGDTELRQSGADWVWTAQFGKTVKSLKQVQDATAMVSHQWDEGETPSYSDVPLTAAASSTYLTDLGWPMLEAHASYSSVSELATLQDHADEEIAVGARMGSSWSFAAAAFPTATPMGGEAVKSGPWLGDYAPGDYAQLHVGENVFGLPIRQRVRIYSFTASEGDEFVQVACMDDREVV